MAKPQGFGKPQKAKRQAKGKTSTRAVRHRGGGAMISPQQLLINELDLIPETWSLVPVREKRPYRAGWQTEPTIPRHKLRQILENGDRQWSEGKQKFWTAYPEGYGIRTGEWSGGLLAIDVDGPTAEILLQAISLGEIPTTVAWTSGKPGRQQLLYQLSVPLQARLKAVGFTHVAIKEVGEFQAEGDEQLDLRYDRCQSVLPPSKHPTTGSYRWINSPENTEVAAAPQWLEDWLNQHCARLEQAEQERIRKQAEAEGRRAYFRSQFPDSEEISTLTLLNAINPEFLDWYEWRNCLLAAQHEGLSESEVRLWSSGSTKHTDRGFDDVWRHIKDSGSRLVTGGTLWHFATKQGWRPERKQQQEQNWSEPDRSEYEAFVRQSQERDQAEQIAAEQIAAEQRRRERSQQQRERFSAETQAIQAELNTLRAEPTIQASGRYIPSGLLQLPSKSGIILIDAPMGSGKTSTVLKDLKDLHAKRYPDAVRYSFSPRNILGMQSGEILGLPHHTELKGFSVPTEASLCLESGHKVPPDRLPKQPPLLFFDEPSAANKQILEGNTCKDFHVFVLNRYRELLQFAAEHGGWVVLAEDGLTNLELDFVREASGLEVVDFLKFDRVTEARDYLLFDSPSMTWDAIESRLLEGENLIGVSDSQKWLRETERMLIQSGIPEDQVFVIDSQSSEEAWAKEFAKNPDAWIEANRPRFLGLSPSLGMGVSINDPKGHFAAVAIHLVHLEPRAAKQLPERLRTNVPRFGYVKERGATDDNLFSGCRPDLILRDLYRNQSGVAKLTQFAEYASEKRPVDADGNPLDLIALMQRIEAEKDDLASDYGFYLKYWAQYRARETYGKLNLRENLIKIWQQQGHSVEILEGCAIKAQGDRRKGIREELDREDAIAFAQTVCNQLSLSESHEILNRLGATSEQRLEARKRLLQDKLPGCNLDDPEFVLKVVVREDGRFLKTTEMLWLARNPEYAKQLDRWNWLGAFSKGARRGEIVWIPQLTMRSAQAKLLNQCPLEPFIKGRVGEWTNSTPEAIAVHQWALLHSRQFRRYLRLTVSEDHQPVKTVNKLLKKLGFEIEQNGYVGRTRKDKGERLYRITNLEDADRESILNALTDRFLKRCGEKGDESVIATRTVDTPPASCDHGDLKPHWFTPGVQADIETWWSDSDPNIRTWVLENTPPAVLDWAIGTGWRVAA